MFLTAVILAVLFTFTKCMKSTESIRWKVNEFVLLPSMNCVVGCIVKISEDAVTVETIDRKLAFQSVSVAPDELHKVSWNEVFENENRGNIEELNTIVKIFTQLTLTPEGFLNGANHDVQRKGSLICAFTQFMHDIQDVLYVMTELQKIHVDYSDAFEVLYATKSL